MTESHPPHLSAELTRRTFGLSVGMISAGLALSAAGCAKPAQTRPAPSEVPTSHEALSGQEALNKLSEDVSMNAMVARTMLSDIAPGRTIQLKDQSAVNTSDMLDIRFQKNPNALSLAAVQIRKGEGRDKATLELQCTLGTIDPSQAYMSTSELTRFLSVTQMSWIIKDKALVADIRSGRKGWSELLQIMADPERRQQDMKLDSFQSTKDDNLSYIRRPLTDGISVEVADTRKASPTFVTLYPTQDGFSAANNDAQALSGTIIKKVSGA